MDCDIRNSTLTYVVPSGTFHPSSTCHSFQYSKETSIIRSVSGKVEKLLTSMIDCMGLGGSHITYGKDLLGYFYF